MCVIVSVSHHQEEWIRPWAGEEYREGLGYSVCRAGGQASRWGGVVECASVITLLVHKFTGP